MKIFSKLNYFIFGYFDPTNVFFFIIKINNFWGDLIGNTGHDVGIDADERNLDHFCVGQPLPAQNAHSDSTILDLAKRSKLISWAAQF